MFDSFAMQLQNCSMWINRFHEDTIKRLFSQFPAVVITGARQTGKTSLVQKVFPDITYRSFDLPAEAALAEHSPEAFFRRHGLPLVLDEVQYVPGIFRHLKVLIDSQKRPGLLLLTGSQVFPLMQGVSESLAGRCAFLDLYTLSAAEVAAAFGDKYDSLELLFRGGFPELQARPELDRQAWYAAYLAAYLERDLRNLASVGSLRDFERFLRAAAARTGSILSYSDLARDVGIAPNTARRWMSMLQASGQVLLLEPYFRNVGKRLVKSPKLYLCDTGLAAFLLGFESSRALAGSLQVGALWESLCVMEVVKVLSSRGRRPPVWFWRTASGDEVDLVLERDGRFVLMECKFAEMVGEAELKGIRRFRDHYGASSVAAAYVVCRTRQSYPLGREAVAVPLEQLAGIL
jgi:predicted AAA+ superfamily ATPase